MTRLDLPALVCVAMSLCSCMLTDGGQEQGSVTKPLGYGRCAPVEDGQTLLAEGLDGPGYLALDEGSLYFAEMNIGAGRVLSMPKQGGPRTTIGTGAGAYGIAVDDENVYWLIYDNVGALYRAPKAGGEAVALAGVRRATELAQDRDSLYWMETGSLGSDYKDGEVKAMPKLGEPITTLASQIVLLDQIAVTDSFVYWTHRLHPGAGAETDEVAEGELVRVPKTGGAPVRVWGGMNVSALAVDHDWVYWSAASGVGVYPNAIWKAPHRGGAPEMVVETGDTIWRMRVDGPCIYFIDHASEVLRVDIGGGAPGHVAYISSYGSWLATDATRVFVSEYQAGVIWSINK